MFSDKIRVFSSMGAIGAIAIGPQNFTCFVLFCYCVHCSFIAIHFTMMMDENFAGKDLNGKRKLHKEQKQAELSLLFNSTLLRIVGFIYLLFYCQAQPQLKLQLGRILTFPPPTNHRPPTHPLTTHPGKYQNDPFQLNLVKQS